MSDPDTWPIQCVVDGCDTPVAVKKRGLCGAHYSRWKRHGDPTAGGMPKGRNLPCEVDGCDGRAAIRMMCVLHYQRWLHHGRTETLTQEDRFWSQVNKTDGCWEWTGSRMRKGYGNFGVDYRHEGAHRFSWRLHFGEIPEGMWVLHRCDNPPCVRPDHLFLGTAQANSDDMVAKGRQKRPRAVVSTGDVAEIRRLYATGEFSQSQLGNRFGISQTQVGRIVRRVRWRSVA